MEIKESVMIGLIAAKMGQSAADRYVEHRDRVAARDGGLRPQHISTGLHFAGLGWLEMGAIREIEQDRILTFNTTVPWWFCRREISFSELVRYIDVVWGPQTVRLVTLDLHEQTIVRIIRHEKVVGGWFVTRIGGSSIQYSCFIVDRDQVVSETNP